MYKIKYRNGDVVMAIPEEVNIEKSYGKECLLPKEEFIKQYSIQENGLTTAQAQERLQKIGLNEISQAKPKKWYHYFLESLFSPFNSILLGIVAVLLYTDVYLPEDPSFANIVVILVLKETIMIAGASFLYGKSLVVSSKWYGKLTTVLIYIAVVSSCLIKIFNLPNFDIYIYVLAIIFAIFSLIKYFIYFYGNGYLPNKEELKKQSQTVPEKKK